MIETDAQCPSAEALACSWEVDVALLQKPQGPWLTLHPDSQPASQEEDRSPGGLSFLPWHAQGDTGKAS